MDKSLDAFGQKELHNLSDEALIEMGQEGDFLALYELMERHKKSVYSVFNYHIQDLKDHHEDLYQELCLNIFKSIVQSKPGNFRAWLRTSARNLAFYTARKLNRQHKFEVLTEKEILQNTTSEWSLVQMEVWGSLNARDQLLRVLKESSELSPMDYRILNYMIEGKGNKEISELEGVTERVIWGHKMRLRERLQLVLNK